MMKAIKEHEQKESSPQSPVKEKMETVVYLSVNSPLNFIFNYNVTGIFTPFLFSLANEHGSGLFQPPRS